MVESLEALVCNGIEYRKSSRLGSGSFGNVVAMNSKCGQQVATKIVAVETAEEMNRAAREVVIMQNLNHPNIVQCFGFIMMDQSHCAIVQECVKFGSTLLRWGDYLSYEEVQFVFSQLVSAVHYMHSHNVAHCDLKPSNVLLLEDNTVKVCDFGVSRWISTDAWGCEVPQYCDGTPAYESPDKFAGRETLATKDDIWALGIMLVFLLVDFEPWFLPTEEDGRFSAWLRDPSPLLSRIESLDENAAEVIRGTLVLDEHRRFTIDQMSLCAYSTQHQ